jgi:hypothetical protein
MKEWYQVLEKKNAVFKKIGPSYSTFRGDILSIFLKYNTSAALDIRLSRI